MPFAGTIFVVVSVLGGYFALTRNLWVLWHPLEYLIVTGAALGVFITCTPRHKLKNHLGHIVRILRGKNATKKDFLAITEALYQIFRISRLQGDSAVETHIEAPLQSRIFRECRPLKENPARLSFLCDHMKLLISSVRNPEQLECVISAGIEARRFEAQEVNDSLSVIADGLPALGIVAAVLGMIKSLGALASSPEDLGALIAGALVGTFYGIFLAYGFVIPFNELLIKKTEEDFWYFEYVKLALLAFTWGKPPVIALELAQRSLPPYLQITASEMEKSFKKIALQQGHASS